jgi:integrase
VEGKAAKACRAGQAQAGKPGHVHVAHRHLDPPHLGQLEIETIRNGIVKQFAETISKKLGPKTTREVVALVKMILESHVNEDGEQILDLSKWNSEFILSDVPNSGKPKQSTITRDALNAVLRNRSLKVRDRVFIALAASTGMRVGELLGLKIDGGKEDTSWVSAESVIQIRKSIYRGELQLPKTESSRRLIDLSTPVQNMIEKFADGRQPGELLFATRTGKPLEPSHVRKYIMLPNGIQGAHVLRRFRTTWCEEQGTPRSLLDAWIGHSNGYVTDRYIKSAEDREYRRKQVERIGTGLNLGDAVAPQSTKKSRRKNPQPGPPQIEEIAVAGPDPVRVEEPKLADIPADISADISTDIPAEPTYVASDEDLPEIFSTTAVLEEVQ